jgi:WD40 repeat protein
VGHAGESEADHMDLRPHLKSYPTSPTTNLASQHLSPLLSLDKGFQLANMSSFKSKTPSLPSQAVGASVDRDQAVTSNVTDTISTLRWSPVASYLAASSWDGKVHIYDVANDLTAKGVGVIDTGSPVFTCDWNQVSLNASNPTARTIGKNEGNNTNIS